MIIVGLEDCSNCKIVKKLLGDVEYIELKRGKTTEKSSESLLEIKKILSVLNPGGHFPVVLNDEKTKLITTDVLLDNLSKNQLLRLFETN